MAHEKSNNPISVRSRTWITDALLELMENQPYQKISIKEITEKAGLVRKTFYRNFSSKEDVLEAYIDQLMKKAEEQFEELDELTPYIMAKLYFEFWQEHLHFLNLLQRNDLFLILLKQLDSYLPEINAKYKQALLADFTGAFLEYYNVFNSAGIWHILEKWIERGAKETPEQMAEIYSDLILNNPHMK